MQVLQLDDFGHLFKTPEDKEKFTKLFTDLTGVTKVVFGKEPDDYIIAVPTKLIISRAIAKGLTTTELQGNKVVTTLSQDDFQETAMELSVNSLLAGS